MRLLPFLLLIVSCLAFGQETYIYPNGDKYVGEFKNGKKHGQGTYYFLGKSQWKGDKYVGEYKDDKKHGQGKYTFADGSEYVGELSNDNVNGIGARTFENGDKYVGEFKDGKMHGQGTYYFLGKSQWKGDKYVGEYRNDKKHGQGKYTFADGSEYVGELSNDNMNGNGTLIWPNGDRYIGAWKDGQMHGEGITLAKDGRKFEGIYENSKFISEAKVNIPNLNHRITTDADRADMERQRQQLVEERRRIEEEKRQQQAENNNPNKQTTITDSRRRLALVIGNAAYRNSPLRNPTNDADIISNALSSSGFIVSRYDNLTYAKMREVVRTFGEKLNRGDVGLFYFSGHAVQYRGKNYLLPINEDLKHADEIPSTAMDIDFVLAKMETAKNDLNIVILDACRNNPLGSEARNLDRGLTTISAAKGTFIAFATSPGNVALDGTGRNSPYTKNLVQAILKGGLSLEQVFKEVRRNVISETSSQQVPWENSSILGDFYFR
jgi:hypothetical protein